MKVKKQSYTIYHATNPTFQESQAKHFPKGYNRVAMVTCPDLDDAYRKTNTVQHPWITNTDVTVSSKVKKAGGCRSTSVGDVIVDNVTKKRYVVAMVGFSEV